MYYTKIAPQLIHNPTHNIAAIQSLKAFTDDVVIHATSDPNETIEDLQNRAKTQLEWWAQLVQVTGGALNPKKYCGIVYCWEPDKHGILRLIQPQLPTDYILIPNENGQHPIPVTKVSEGPRYLGIYITADRNTKPMEQHLWKKALLYTQAFHQTPIYRGEVGMLYWSCFLPVLTCPLPASWLPNCFFDKVHHLSTSTMLNKMGFHRNLPRKMVFAPCTSGGVGWSL